MVVVAAALLLPLVDPTFFFGADDVTGLFCRGGTTAGLTVGVLPTDDSVPRTNGGGEVVEEGLTAGRSADFVVLILRSVVVADLVLTTLPSLLAAFRDIFFRFFFDLDDNKTAAGGVVVVVAMLLLLLAEDL